MDENISVLYNTFKKYFSYQLQITFSNGISNTFLNYIGKVSQNTKYIFQLRVFQVLYNIGEHWYWFSTGTATGTCNVITGIGIG